MKTTTLLKSASLSTRLRTLFFTLALLSMFNMSAITEGGVLEIGDITTSNLNADAQTMTIATYTGTTGLSIIIPDSFEIDEVKYAVIDIAANVFRGKSLTGVQLPSGLISIGLRSFQTNTEMSAIIIPASVETIGRFCFAETSGGGVTFETGSNLVLVEDNAFRGGTVYLPTVKEGYTATWKTEDGVVVESPYTIVASEDYVNVWVDASAASSVLTFNANTADGTMASVTSTVGVTEVLPANTFTKDGYYFKGWATTADGDVIYTDGVGFEFVNEVEQLFAIWGELCDLILDNGEGVQETYEVGLDLTQTIPASTFVKEGYYLYGWATTATGDAYYSFEALYTPSLATQTLYAIWEPIPAGYVSMGSEMLKISEFTPVIVNQTLSITAYNESGQDSTNFYIPSSYVIEGVVYTVTELGSQSFKSKGLTNVILPNTLTILRDRAFHNNSLLSITIPASVTELEEYALAYNYFLKEVIFEDESQLQKIGVNVFYNHQALDSITIPARVEYIGKNAFNGREGFSNSFVKVKFEEGSQLDSIAAGAFDLCESLVSITLPTIRPGYTVEWSQDDVVLTSSVVLNAAFASVFTADWTENTPTAMQETIAKDQLVISPNPANNSFTLNVASVATQIYSLSGQCMKEFPMGVSTFDISSLDRGMYLVKVEEANGNVSVEQLMKE